METLAHPAIDPSNLLHFSKSFTQASFHALSKELARSKILSLPPISAPAVIVLTKVGTQISAFAIALG